MVSRASGLSRPTLHKGLRELSEEPLPTGQIRRAGGGRKRVEVADPSVLRELERLVEPATRGDPQSPLRWTSKSTRHLAAALAKVGYSLSHQTVAQMLWSLDYKFTGHRQDA